MDNTQIDKQIKALESEKYNNTIRKNLKKNRYDTPFFTYEANYKKKVHFSYLASTSCGHNSYAILCKEDAWLSSYYDDGYPLSIIELLDGEAIFMNWKEAVRDICPKCAKYLSWNSVILENAKKLKLKGDKILKNALDTKSNLYEQSERLKQLVEETSV